MVSSSTKLFLFSFHLFSLLLSPLIASLSISLSLQPFLFYLQFPRAPITFVCERPSHALSPSPPFCLLTECGQRRGDEVFPSDAVVLCPDPTSHAPPPHQSPNQLGEEEEETQQAPSQPNEQVSTTPSPQPPHPSPISEQEEPQDQEEKDFFNTTATTVTDTELPEDNITTSITTATTSNTTDVITATNTR